LAGSEVINRIFFIMKELKDKGISVKLMSFFNELHVKVKMKVVYVDKGKKVVGWEGSSKLNCAIDETRKIYFRVFDPKYEKRWVLGADVIYYSNDYIETSFPKFVFEPKLNRKFVRVATSDKLPVKMRLRGNFRKIYDVIDISEGGIAFISEPGLFKTGDVLEMKLILPDSKISVSCEVVNKSSYGKNLERFGVKFIGLDNESKKLINRYILKRQKEIISKIKLLNGGNLW